MTGITSLQDFYREIGFGNELNTILPGGIDKEIGHFNVFSTAAVRKSMSETKIMPYNRRAYYKISLINGHNRAEYADKVIDIKKHGLLFASPRVPYNYIPLDGKQGGHFCIFTQEFLAPARSGPVLDELPIFKAGGYPVFQLSASQAKELEALFQKMFRELASDYAYKYDLLRNYVLEMIHYGQKLQPDIALYTSHNATTRIAGLFVELLERQFPITSPQQQLELRTAKRLCRAAGHPCQSSQQSAEGQYRQNHHRCDRQPYCAGSPGIAETNRLEHFRDRLCPWLR